MTICRRLSRPILGPPIALAYENSNEQKKVITRMVDLVDSASKTNNSATETQQQNPREANKKASPILKSEW